MRCEFWGHSVSRLNPDTAFSIFPGWEPPDVSNSERQDYSAGEPGAKPFREAPAKKAVTDDHMCSTNYQVK